VQDLIEQAPEAPLLDKREADVSVLFLDIAGYTRLSERLDPAEMNALIERYLGTFLDEILKRGRDVNATAGDGLLVILQDPHPGRRPPRRPGGERAGREWTNRRPSAPAHRPGVGAEAVPGQPPLVGPVRVGGEEPVHRVEHRLGAGREVGHAVADSARDQEPVAAAGPQGEALDVPRRRRALPEVDEPDEEARVRRDDPEVLLGEVEVPALHRARLEQAPVPLDRAKAAQPVDVPAF